jgi:STIP1 family protein 1
MREADRIRRRTGLLGELETKLDDDRKSERAAIEARRISKEIGAVAADEESQAVEETFRAKVNELRNSFAISNPAEVEKRVRIWCCCSCNLMLMILGNTAIPH